VVVRTKRAGRRKRARYIELPLCFMGSEVTKAVKAGSILHHT
jgi:hypothetical protein